MVDCPGEVFVSTDTEKEARNFAETFISQSKVKLLEDTSLVVHHRTDFSVGGACRDFIAGLKGENCDWDICAPVRAEEFSAAAERAGFKVSAVFKQIGTNILVLSL